MEYETQFVGVFGQTDGVALVGKAGDDDGVEAVPKGVQFAGLRAVRPAEGAHAYVFHRRGAGGELRQLVGASVEACPRNQVVGAGPEVETDVVGLQFVAFNLPLLEEGALVVADKEGDLVDFVLESVGKLHIIIVHIMQTKFARRQGVVVDIVAGRRSQ